MKNRNIEFIVSSIFITIILISPTSWAEDKHDHDNTGHHQNHTDHHNEHGHDDHSGAHHKGAHSASHEGHEGHDDHDTDHHEHGHHEENETTIGPVIAAKVGIKTSIAKKTTLYKTITTYGALHSGPEQISHVRARFEGLVKSVKFTIGDTVSTGDLLAEIESNDSLRSYRIQAPISGTVVQRHANTGEVTQDQVLFAIANFDTLWAELRIPPGYQTKVRKGQNVTLLVNDLSLKTKIEHVIPAPEKAYQIARAKLNNRKYRLNPGLLVEAHIKVSQLSVPVAVNTDAVQSLRGKKGVFVKQGNRFIFTPLEIGQQDGQFIEVISGLDQGQEYVSQNSYLIKADIEKSEAEHDH